MFHISLSRCLKIKINYTFQNIILFCLMDFEVVPRRNFNCTILWCSHFYRQMGVWHLQVSQSVKGPLFCHWMMCSFLKMINNTAVSRKWCFLNKHFPPNMIEASGIDMQKCWKSFFRFFLISNELVSICARPSRKKGKIIKKIYIYLFH